MQRAIPTPCSRPWRTICNGHGWDPAHRFIADGDYVVMEASGENATPDGKIYNNKYCWVCRITDGQLHELREYMDTQLVTDTFAANKK